MLKRARRSADITGDMVLRRSWIAAALGLALGAFGVFLFLVVLGNANGGPVPPLEEWLYQALIVAAALITGARAVLVRDDRLAWAVMAAALVCNAFGELYSLAVDPTDFPSPADVGCIAFYPLPYVASCCCCRAAHGRSPARSGSTGSPQRSPPPRSAPRCSSSSFSRTPRARPRRSSTNLAYPLGDVLLLSAVFGVFSLDGLAARPALAPPRPRRPRDRRSRTRSTSSSRRTGTYVEGTWIDILWPAAMLLVALVRLDARPDARGARGRGPPAPRRAGGLRARRDRHPRLRPLHRREPARDRPRLGDARARRRAARGDVPRERAPLRADAPGGDDRRAHRTRQPPAARRRSRAHVCDASRCAPTLLMLFDLDGFKGYNDTFGHPGRRRAARAPRREARRRPGPDGAAYRLGGDEFCLIVARRRGRGRAAHRPRLRGARPSAARGSRSRPRSAPSCSPTRRPTRATRCRLADERLYAQKYSRRGESDRTMAALLEALVASASPSSRASWRGVGALAVDVGRMLGLAPRRARGARSRGAAPRPRQARRPRRDPLTSPARSTSASGRSSASTRSSASGSSARRRRCAASRRIVRSSPRELGRQRLPGRRSPARRSRSLRGSSARATRSSR